MQRNIAVSVADGLPLYVRVLLRVAASLALQKAVSANDVCYGFLNLVATPSHDETQHVSVVFLDNIRFSKSIPDADVLLAQIVCLARRLHSSQPRIVEYF